MAQPRAENEAFAGAEPAVQILVAEQDDRVRRAEHACLGDIGARQTRRQERLAWRSLWSTRQGIRCGTRPGREACHKPPRSDVLAETPKWCRIARRLHRSRDWAKSAKYWYRRSRKRRRGQSRFSLACDPPVVAALASRKLGQSPAAAAGGRCQGASCVRRRGPQAQSGSADDRQYAPDWPTSEGVHILIVG